MGNHGLWGTHRKTYQCWSDMKQRCLNPKHKQFPNYGARGITVCTAWLNSFDKFLSDMGTKPDGMTIDRIDNSGGYEPNNCRWATTTQQCCNRRGIQHLTFMGATMPIEHWGRRIGRDPCTIRYRIKRGLPMEIVLSPTELSQKKDASHKSYYAARKAQP